MIEPETAEDGGRLSCRRHRTPLLFDPEWAFSVFAEYPGIGWASENFPNVKSGHPATPEMAGHELVGLWHCPMCEKDRQHWFVEKVSSPHLPPVTGIQWVADRASKLQG
jgi:hypothetical protein